MFNMVVYTLHAAAAVVGYFYLKLQSVTFFV